MPRGFASFRLSSTVKVPRIKKLQELLADTSTITAEIGSRIMTEIRDNIESEGKAPWAKWPPMAESTRYKRIALGNPKGLLEGLKDKFAVTHGKTQVTIKGTDPLVALHHAGTKRGWRIPKTGRGLLVFPYPPPHNKPAKLEGNVWWVFARSVRHPGLKRRPMIPPFYVNRDIAIEIVERRIREITSD